LTIDDYDSRQSSICNRQSAIVNLQSAICNLQFGIWNFEFGTPLYSTPHMEILESHVQMLHAIANRIIPPDDTPGAGDNETLGHAAEIFSGPLLPRVTELRKLLDGLNLRAKVDHQQRFVDLEIETQDALLKSVEEQPMFKQLCELLHEGYWASGAGQRTAGFVIKG
jgi:hypothetical protein